MREFSDKDLSAARSLGNGSITHKTDWMRRGPRERSRTSYAASSARPIKSAPMPELKCLQKKEPKS